MSRLNQDIRNAIFGVPFEEEEQDVSLVEMTDDAVFRAATDQPEQVEGLSSEIREAISGASLEDALTPQTFETRPGLSALGEGFRAAREVGTRSTIQAGEAFNETFRQIVNPVLSLTTGGRVQWQDQRQFLDPAESRAEQAMDVAAESMGTIASFIVPFAALGRYYQAARSAAPAMRGYLPESLARPNTMMGRVQQRVAAAVPEPVARAVSSARQRVVDAVPEPVARTASQARQTLVDYAQGIRQVPDVVTRGYVTAPGVTAAFEAGSAVGAGVGAGIAELFSPGDTTARATGEIIGGFSPLAVAARNAVAVKSGFKNIVAKFSSQERLKVRLSNIIEGGVKKGLEREATLSGQDLTPEQVQETMTRIINSLSASPEDPIRLTSGLQSQHEAVLAFEGAIARTSPTFRAERAEVVRQAQGSLDNFVMSELNSGDPTRMVVAADLARANYKATFDKALSEAQRRMSESLSKLIDQDPLEASRTVSKIINDSLDRARKTEKVLWNQIERIDPLDSAALGGREASEAFGNSIAAYRSASAESTATDRVPFAKDFSLMRRAVRYRALQDEIASLEAIDPNNPDLVDLYERLLTTPKAEYPLQKMFSLHSRLLEMGRVSAANDQPSRARVHYELAEAVMADLQAMPEISPEHTIARAFSAELNNAFTRTFASQLTGTDKLGTPRISAERALEVAFGGGRGLGRERFLELQRAGTDVVVNADGSAVLDSSVLGPQIRSTQEQFLRAHVNKFVNSRGEISPERLNNFLSDPANQQLLAEMPTLHRDLSEIESARVLVAEATSAKVAGEAALKRAAFSRLLGDAPPDDVIRNVLKQSNAGERIAELAQFARNSGDEALGGLRHSLLKAVFDQASTKAGTSWIELNRLMASPVSAGDLSPSQMLLQNRIMTEAEYNNFMRIVQRGVDLENALLNPRVEEIALEINDPLQDLLVRLSGASMGSQISSVMPGAVQGRGLVFAGATVRTFRNAFEKIPAGKLQELAIRAARDPEFMKEVLMTTYTPANRAQLERQANLFMLEAGINVVREDEDPEFRLQIWE